MKKRDQLLKLMRENQLKGPDVALLLNRAPQTVRVWLCRTPHEIPTTALELLQLKLAARQEAAQHEQA